MSAMGVAADSVPERLIGWATQVAARFARPVDLVGSALELPDPRDWDLRCVLADEEFESRYGHAANYLRGCWVPSSVPAMRLYWSDMAKLNEQAVRAVSLNIDFQVQPAHFAKQFSSRPRKRVDLVDGLTHVIQFGVAS